MASVLNVINNEDEEYNITSHIKDLRIFSSISALRQALESQVKQLQTSKTASQYIAFLHVPKAAMQRIEHYQDEGKFIKCVRLTYDSTSETLVVKLMPSGADQIAYTYIHDMIREVLLLDMGIGIRQILNVGARRFKGREVGKEGDLALMPRSVDPVEGWPSLVFETGLSESLSRLRLDATWWLRTSNAAVRIVLVIAVKASDRSMTIEKWEVVDEPRQGIMRSVPKATQKILVTENSVDNHPLILEFEKLMLRQPVAPEHDIIFTDVMLQRFAAEVWRHP